MFRDLSSQNANLDLCTNGVVAAAENVAHGLVGNAMAENLECSGDAIISPAAILTRQADDQFCELTSEARSSWIEAVPRAVELVSDEPPEPGEDGLRFGSRSHRLESLASEPFADDGQEWNAGDRSGEGGKADAPAKFYSRPGDIYSAAEAADSPFRHIRQ
jgi:hypothetical protein